MIINKIGVMKTDNLTTCDNFTCGALIDKTNKFKEHYYCEDCIEQVKRVYKILGRAQ